MGVNKVSNYFIHFIKKCIYQKEVITFGCLKIKKTMEDFRFKLCEILQCSVCLESASTLTVKLLQCSEGGHLICQACYRQLVRPACPVCRSHCVFYTSVTINKLVEVISQGANSSATSAEVSGGTVEEVESSASAMSVAQVAQLDSASSEALELQSSATSGSSLEAYEVAFYCIRPQCPELFSTSDSALNHVIVDHRLPTLYATPNVVNGMFSYEFVVGREVPSFAFRLVSIPGLEDSFFGGYYDRHTDLWMVEIWSTSSLEASMRYRVELILNERRTRRMLGRMGLSYRPLGLLANNRPSAINIEPSSVVNFQRAQERNRLLFELTFFRIV